MNLSVKKTVLKISFCTCSSIIHFNTRIKQKESIIITTFRHAYRLNIFTISINTLAKNNDRVKAVIRERDTLIFKESLHFSDGHINTIYRTLYFDSIVINITLGKNVRIPIMDVEMNNHASRYTVFRLKVAVETTFGHVSTIRKSSSSYMSRFKMERTSILRGNR